MLNLLIVWAATGIWHGASWNYLFWGLYFFCLLMLEKLLLGKWLEKLPAVFRHLYVIVLVLISWAIFALEDLGHLGWYLRAMIGLNGAQLTNGQAFYYLRNFFPILIAASIGSTPLAVKLWKRVTSPVIRILVLVLGLILCAAYVVASTYNPFLYFRF